MWIMSAITKFIPKNHVSFFMGWLAHLPLPRFIWTPIIRLFASQYNISLAEAEFPVDHYASLGEFFVRKLKPGIRPLGSLKVVHPADSLVTQCDRIANGKLIQAKNKFYSVSDLTADPNALKKYDGGFFLTYYLCPTDYHRVHSPVTGVIKRVTHIPGTLWPVNAWSTENVPELFSVNERICVEIETYQGLVNVIFVGATNVGQIELAFDEEVRGNQLVLSKELIKDQLSIAIEKGSELGCFRMGSTIVALYSNNFEIDQSHLKSLRNCRVKVNSDFF
jgi:phosphatidylserine decarboxylase